MSPSEELGTLLLGPYLKAGGSLLVLGTVETPPSEKILFQQGDGAGTSLVMTLLSLQSRDKGKHVSLVMIFTFGTVEP